MKRKLAFAGLAAAVLAVGVSMAPAAEAAEGRTTLLVDSCYGTQDVELKGSPAHDYMSWTIPSTKYTCVVRVIDNGSQIDSRVVSSGAAHVSGSWYYDGPGNSMKICFFVPPHGLSLGGEKCGPLN